MQLASFAHFVVAAAAAVGPFASSPASAQWSPDWIGQVPTGSALSSGLSAMVTDAAGVTYITGINGPSFNTDVITAAFAPDGTELWQRTYNGPGDWHDQSRGICLGPGGVVYVVGNTPGPGNYGNVLLLKYDAVTGATLDVIQQSSAPFTSEHGQSVATDAAGNVYIGGGTVGDGADGLMLSFDAAGALRWSATYDGPAFGPFSQDHLRQVQVGPDGNVYAMVHGVMGTNHGDFVVIKYDANSGSVIWQTAWGVFGEDSANDMAIDAAGDVYVTGTGLDFVNKISTLKLRGSDGQLLWQAYDANGGTHHGTAVALDGLGGVYITGSSDPDGDESNFNDDFFTIKRSASNGAQAWTHHYGDPCVGCFDTPGDVIVDTGGNVLVVGSTSSAPYVNDLIMFRLDAQTGAEIDRSTVIGSGSESIGAAILRLDGAGNIHAGGGYYNYDTGIGSMAVFRWGALDGNPGPMPGDADGNGMVDVDDLVQVIVDWGPCDAVAPCPSDLTADGRVGIDDVVMVVLNWS